MHSSVKKLKDGSFHLWIEVKPSSLCRYYSWFFRWVGKIDEDVLPISRLSDALDKNNGVGNGFIELPRMNLKLNLCQDRLIKCLNKLVVGVRCKIESQVRSQQPAEERKDQNRAEKLLIANP